MIQREAAMAEPSRDLARWQWHPQVRETWADERLYFWRLSFPTYDRHRIVYDIEEVMERAGVLAYAVYELYGGFDVLLRVWLPTTQAVFEAAVQDVFKHDPNIVVEGFSVNHILSHWPWMRDGVMRRLDSSDLERRLPNREISRINAGLQLTALSDYQERGLLAPSWHSQGIKFGVVIGPSRQALSQAAERRITEGLSKVLRDADPEVFVEKSLYKGMGFGSYLILARVEGSAFHHIEREITLPINAIVAPEAFGSRTTTFVMSTEDVLSFSDRMRLSHEATVRRSAREWLEDDESQHLEVKASAFLELNQWLLGEKEAPGHSDVPTESLMKAVCGLLNAEGGTVILGALEESRYPDNLRLADAPRVGQYVVWGLQPEGGRDWDKYARRLRDIMASRIHPDPNDHIEIDRDGVGKRPICTITVREPARPATGAVWYWHFPKGQSAVKFWVREGNRTRERIGPEIDLYKTEKTRRAAGGL